MAKRITDIFPAQSLIIIFMCIAGVLVFIFLFILPTQKTSAELDKKIEEKQNQIDRQKILKPVFERMLVKATAKSPTRLPMVEKAKLSRGDMKKISDQIQSLMLRALSEKKKAGISISELILTIHVKRSTQLIKNITAVLNMKNMTIYIILITG